MDSHPIVAQMRPSAEQRPAVVIRDRDVVVTAGAGTGKTRTLVARYLALLAEGLPARSILAITFTRKAAREMRNRVREEIWRYVDAADLGEDERAVWQQHARELDLVPSPPIAFPPVDPIFSFSDPPAFQQTSGCAPSSRQFWIARRRLRIRCARVSAAWLSCRCGLHESVRPSWKCR